MPDRRLLPFLLIALVAPVSGTTSGELFCCTDPASGRRICGDTLPPVCRGQAHRIYDKAGNPIKDVAATLTPEQKAAAAAAAEREKHLEEEKRERRRIDQALLSTYATAEDIDMAQSKAEGDVKLTIRDATAKITELQKRQRKLAEEAEFYKRKTMPAELETNLRTVGHEIRLQQELIEIKRKELATISGKYEGDRRRYYELTGRRSSAPSAPAVTPPASPSAVR